MSNNKNAITKLNEAPINTQINTRWEGRGKSTEKRVRERVEGEKKDRKTGSKGRRKKERLICCASAAPAATKTSYGGTGAILRK